MENADMENNNIYETEEQNGTFYESENSEENSTEIRKCASCGANMVYDPEARALKCPYCGTDVELKFDNTCNEQNFYKLFNKDNNDWGEETHVFRCENCGAKQVISKTEISKNCAFCGTSNVVELTEISGLKPNAVLPFILAKDKATENVITWAKKRFFAPRKFKKSVKPEEIYGNYSPCFTFDANTYSNYTGTLGEYYYVTVRRNGKSVRERRVRWFSISGNHNSAFDDVLISASDSVKKKEMDKLEPFDTNNAQEYSSDFLQGFTATQYTKDGKMCWHEAQEVMKGRIESQILSKYHYDVVKRLDVNTIFNDVTFKYVLLPLYVGHCSYAKKLYNFFVNGQTGKVAGKTPVSAFKVTVLIILGLAAIAGIIAYMKISGVI